MVSTGLEAMGSSLKIRIKFLLVGIKLPVYMTRIELQAV
jgi:hypothetical protein